MTVIQKPKIAGMAESQLRAISFREPSRLLYNMELYTPSPCSLCVFLLQSLSSVFCFLSILGYQIISNFKEMPVSHSFPTHVTHKMFNKFAEIMDICRSGSIKLSEGEGFHLGISRNTAGFPKISHLWNVRRHSNHKRSNVE